jgi:hypothetical protein
MNMTGKLIRSVSALLLGATAAVLAAGCSGASTTSAYSPDELKAMLANSLLVTSGSTSFHHDMTLAVSGDNPGTGGTTGNFQVNLTSKGVSDVRNQQMQTELMVSFGIKIGDQATQMHDASGQIYQVGGYLYLLAQQAGTTSQWKKVAVSSALSQAYGMDLIKGQFALLAAPVSVTFVKDEKVDGILCHELALNPDPAALIQWIEQQGVLPTDSIDWSKTDLLSQMFQDISVNVWIAKDSSQVTKLAADVKAVITPEMVGDTTPGQPNINLESSLTLGLSDYNKAVTITLPPEAQSAPEVSAKDFALF